MVLPIGDRNPTRRTPFVTWALVAANIGIFAFVQPWMEGTCDQVAFFLEWAVIPAELPQGDPLSAEQLANTAAGRCGLSPVEGKPVYAAVITSLFLHASWLHLLGNMLYLWIFGNNIEDHLGHLPFLAFYLCCGVAATAAFAVPNLDSPVTLVGASGAIAGVLGAYLVLHPRARVTVWVPFLLFLFVRLPAFLVLGLWFVLQLAPLQAEDMAGGGGVAYLAHVAGFVVGVVGIFLLGGRPQPEPDDGRRRRRRRKRR